MPIIEQDRYLYFEWKRKKRGAILSHCFIGIEILQDPFGGNLTSMCEVRGVKLDFAMAHVVKRSSARRYVLKYCVGQKQCKLAIGSLRTHCTSVRLRIKVLGPMGEQIYPY